MGRDKAGLVVDGETLLNRQLRLLRETGASELLVVAAAAADPPENLPPGVLVVFDRVAGAGPLAGIDAALGGASEAMVLILAVDLPAMSAVWLQQLMVRCQSGRGVVPRIGGRFEPLAAVYPRTVASEVRARMNGGEVALQPFVRECIANGYLVPWEIPEEEASTLVNWNRPGDWKSG